MIRLRPSFLQPSLVRQHIPIELDYAQPGFIIHPPTSEIAESLIIDPEALANENYTGIYDEAGDYIPQYCDDPEKIPQGAMTANSSNSDSKPGEGDSKPGEGDSKPGEGDSKPAD